MSVVRKLNFSKNASSLHRQQQAMDDGINKKTKKHAEDIKLSTIGCSEDNAEADELWTLPPPTIENNYVYRDPL